MHRFLAAVSFGTLVASSALVVGCGSSSSSGGSCDANALIISKCAMSGCHNPAAPGAAANLDLTMGTASHLLDVAPMGGGPTGLTSVCANMNQVYLKSGSSPATGLFVTKLEANPSCGVQMPYPPYPHLNADDTKCLTDWATSKTKP